MPKHAIVKAPWQLCKLISHRILSMNFWPNQREAGGRRNICKRSGKGVEKWNFGRPSVGQLNIDSACRLRQADLNDKHSPTKVFCHLCPFILNIQPFPSERELRMNSKLAAASYLCHSLWFKNVASPTDQILKMLHKKTGRQMTSQGAEWTRRGLMTNNCANFDNVYCFQIKMKWLLKEIPVQGKAFVWGLPRLHYLPMVYQSKQ